MWEYTIVDSNGVVFTQQSAIPPALFQAALPVGLTVQSYRDLSGSDTGSSQSTGLTIAGEWLQALSYALSHGGAAPPMANVSPAALSTATSSNLLLAALAIGVGLGVVALAAKWL